MFGTGFNPRKEYAGIIKQIESGERMPPSHDIPRSIREPGEGFESFRSPAHDIFFEDFRWLQTMMNHNTAEPWCIEEMSDTLIRDLASDRPELGRRYRVYYNSCTMGTLQVHPGGFGLLDPERFKRERKAWAIVDLEYLRFIPWDHAIGFVRTVHFQLGAFPDYDTAWAKASAAATEALTGYLWEAMRIDDLVMDFNHSFEGPYEVVQQTTEHWANDPKFDPLRQWNGDRPSRDH